MDSGWRELGEELPASGIYRLYPTEFRVSYRVIC